VCVCVCVCVLFIWKLENFMPCMISYQHNGPRKICFALQHEKHSSRAMQQRSASAQANATPQFRTTADVQLFWAQSYETSSIRLHTLLFIWVNWLIYFRRWIILLSFVVVVVVVVDSEFSDPTKTATRDEGCDGFTVKQGCRWLIDCYWWWMIAWHCR
jgi:hypothetical protein